MSRGWFKLNPDHTITPCDILDFANQCEDHASRIVRQEHVGKTLVSTVFLGLDHGMGGTPLLFETMSFPDAPRSYNETHCERCSTWDEAVDQHARIVELVRIENLWYNRLLHKLLHPWFPIFRYRMIRWLRSM